MAVRPRAERKTTGQLGLQRVAVTLQLAVSILFIVAAWVVMLQMRFVNHKDLGFDRNGIVYLSGIQLFINEDVRVALLKELASIPQVGNVTDTYFYAEAQRDSFRHKNGYRMAGGRRNPKKSAFCVVPTDSRFAETFKVNMLQGEWLGEGGERNVVLNEEAVRAMGLEEPVGTVIRMTLNEPEEYRVVGVVKDFHLFSLRSRILPTIFFPSVYPTNSLYVRAVPGQEQEAIRRINAVLPAIDASFVDVHPVRLSEMYDRLNYSEQAGLKMFSVLAVVCLLISLFGIYAVASASTQRRRKEVAVRKVVGGQSGRYHPHVLP